MAFEFVSDFDVRISDFSLPDNSLPNMMIQSTQLCDSIVPAGLFMAVQPQSCAVGTCAIGIIANPADCFMQNKPNFLMPQMNLSVYCTKAYENEMTSTKQQNKANQTQFIAAKPHT
ncbi:MAG: hypothetical protein ACYSTZ_02695, partial [Planctomycetota bacterium]